MIEEFPIEIPQLTKKPGTALVLSGGATKAFYFHLGVLRVLQPQTQDITSIVGSSAGSIVGAFIASGATVESLITSLYQRKVYIPKFDKWVRTLTSSMLFRPNYQDITKQTMITSFAGMRFLMTLPFFYNKDLIAEVLDKLVSSQQHVAGFFDAVALENLFRSLLPSVSFRDTEVDLYVTATSLDDPIRAVFNGQYDFEDEHNHFMTDVPIHKAVRASTSVPGMFDPVKIKGRFYIDGEVRRTLSVDIGASLADRVIVSHTYQPLHMRGNDSVRDLGWFNIIRQTTSIVFHERIAAWRQIYEHQYPDKKIVWIQPDPEDVEFFLAPEFTFRPELQRQIMDSGEAAARRTLEKIAV